MKMNSFSSSFGQQTFHVRFKVKYCHKIFRFERVKRLCEAILLATAQSQRIEIREIGFGDEHVHLLISISPAMSLAKAVGLLKGSSAFKLFRAFPWLRNILWGGHLWNPAYYFDSVGDSSYERLEEYVRNQQNSIVL